MDSKNLERRCVELYGRNGKFLFRAMEAIHRKDFCVATGWDDNEVSIARCCNSRGKIFKLSNDYKSLIMPDGRVRKIDDLTYNDIVQYLPKPCVAVEQNNCEVDTWQKK